MAQWNGTLSQIIWVYLEVINVAALILYGLDKQYAKFHKWRIPERTLLGTAAIGGSLGALAGMMLFRHKTRKNKFRILVPLFLVMHMGILVYFGMF